MPLVRLLACKNVTVQFVSRFIVACSIIHGADEGFSSRPAHEVHGPELDGMVKHLDSVHQVLNERYLVEHKFDRGGGTTVWMAFDLQDKKDKVMALGKWIDNELRIQDEAVKSVRDTSRLVIYAATFVQPRDDSRHHRVLVFPYRVNKPGTQEIGT